MSQNVYHRLTPEQLNDEYASLCQRYEAFKSRKLRLDMSRGKPCPEQLDLSAGLLDAISSADCLRSDDGMDLRNYGGLDGIPEAKRLFATMLGVGEMDILIGGSSSLAMMYDTLAGAMLHGVYGSDVPWSKLPAVKFLCPSPGYDRHFAICERLGIEMIPVDMQDSGPDMDEVERLVSEDAAIRGIWCVPKYSNPEGITYSDDTVERLARMRCQAADFRIMWDDAYTLHHLTDQPDLLRNMLEACRAAGCEDRVLHFSSTSKISFPGSGVAMMAASPNNLSHYRKQLSYQTIGPDKINQLRHVRFFGDLAALQTHMEKMAAILKPKFDAVLSILEEHLGGKQIAAWNKPNGGYFISLNTLDGCAKAVVDMAAEAGVTLTKAGATYPYGHDPRDCNIRIAPTYPSIDELQAALEILCVCVQLAAVEQLQRSSAADTL
jgi:aspartate/methionine/tyrosine aminotransferase